MGESIQKVKSKNGAKKSMIQDNRTQEELLEHYKIEKELASKLRNASKEERKHLYTSLYDELFKRVPLHPQRGADHHHRSLRDARQDALVHLADRRLRLQRRVHDGVLQR